MIDIVQLSAFVQFDLKCICLLLIIIVDIFIAKAEVSVSTTSVTAPVATRQDVYVGELSDTAGVLG